MTMTRILVGLKLRSVQKFFIYLEEALLTFDTTLSGLFNVFYEFLLLANSIASLQIKILRQRFLFLLTKLYCN